MFIDVVLWMVVAAALVPAHQLALRQRGAALAALLGADLVALALVATAAASEQTWQSVAQEDGLIEWGTTFAFLLAAALNAGALWQRRRIAPVFETLVRVALVLFCIFVAGEEMSWGQRLVGFQPPEIFLEKNFQQEMNLHNVLMDESASGLGFELDSKHMVALIAVIFGVLGPLLVRLRPFRAVAPIAPPVVLAPIFLAVAVAELTYPIDLTGEGAELLLGMLFALAVAWERGARAVAIAVALPLLLAAITAPLISRVIYGSDEAGTATARAELALIADDVMRQATPKLLGKSSIHKRLFTATRDGYFTLDSGGFATARGAALDGTDAGRRKWFLDPWQNPYWIFVEKKGNRAFVYSFGPNRRRDSNVRGGDGAGDDVLQPLTLDR